MCFFVGEPIREYLAGPPGPPGPPGPSGSASDDTLANRVLDYLQSKCGMFNDTGHTTFTGVGNTLFRWST